MYVGNQIMLVTNVVKVDDKIKCYGIIFNGELDDVKSYFVEDKKPVMLQTSKVNIGDIIPVDETEFNKQKDSFESASQKDRINNIITLFEGIKKHVYGKTPVYFYEKNMLESERKYVWQHMHATSALSRSLYLITLGDDKDIRSARDLCVKNLADHLNSSACVLEQYLNRNEYEFVEKQMEALKFVNNMPEKMFSHKSPDIALSDAGTHYDYTLITGVDYENKTCNGVKLCNLLGKGDGRGNLTCVKDVPFVGGSPILGELVGVEETEDAKPVLHKDEPKPRTFDERVNNLYFLNELLFEHYVKDNPKQFNPKVYTAQMELTNALSQMFGLKAEIAMEDGNVDEKTSLYLTLAKNLKDKYKNAKSEESVYQIEALNEEVDITRSMAFLPKTSFSDKNQATLDMF